MMNWPRVFKTAAAVTVLVAEADAGTLRVPADYGSIQSAIDAAAAGDTVLVAPGTYTNCDEPPCKAQVANLFEGLTLVSEGGPDVTRLELLPAGLSSMVTVAARHVGGAGATLEGFEITSQVPASRGFVSFESTNIRVTSCRFLELETAYPDGAGLLQTGGVLEVVDCEFIRNRSTDPGSALRASVAGTDTHLLVKDCLFDSCESTAAWIGGGGFQRGDVEVVGCTFVSNTASETAGALNVSSVATALVENNRFVGNVSRVVGPGAASVEIVRLGCEIRGNLFVRNRHEGSNNGGGAIRVQTEGLCTQNTFVGNESSSFGSAVWDFWSGDLLEFSGNILALNSGSSAYHATFAPRAGDCNVFWANGDGDYFNYQPGVHDLFVAPQFCDIPLDDYTVRSSSPCAVENNPDCGRIGAFGVGCGTVSVDPMSWGRLKSLHRGED